MLYEMKITTPNRKKEPMKTRKKKRKHCREGKNASNRVGDDLLS